MRLIIIALLAFTHIQIGFAKEAKLEGIFRQLFVDSGSTIVSYNFSTGQKRELFKYDSVNAGEVRLGDGFVAYRRLANMKTCHTDVSLNIVCSGELSYYDLAKGQSTLVASDAFVFFTSQDLNEIYFSRFDLAKQTSSLLRYDVDAKKESVVFAGHKGFIDQILGSDPSKQAYYFSSDNTLIRWEREGFKVLYAGKAGKEWFVRYRLAKDGSKVLISEGGRHGLPQLNLLDTTSKRREKLATSDVAFEDYDLDRTDDAKSAISILRDSQGNRAYWLKDDQTQSTKKVYETKHSATAYPCPNGKDLLIGEIRYEDRHGITTFMVLPSHVQHRFEIKSGSPNGPSVYFIGWANP